jgi:hypothetical protein
MRPEDLAKSGTEHGHQMALFCALQQTHDPIFDMLFAIPNGGKRDAVTAARLKAEGVKAGVPDLFFPVARGGWYGACVEMKLVDAPDSAWKTAQRLWCDRLIAQNYYYFVACGWLQAYNFLVAYERLQIPK